MSKSCCVVGGISNKSQNVDLQFVRSGLCSSKLYEAICYPAPVLAAAPIICQHVKRVTCVT